MSARETAQSLYDAFAADDASALMAVLTPTFRGVVSEGMPFDVGGSYEGPQQMLEGVWGPVAQRADVTPDPEEYLEVGDGRVVVVGRYRGTVRATGVEIDAAFAHLLRIIDGRVAELVQITDTARWHDALAGADGHASPDDHDLAR